jgi:hypothetical protein
VIRSTGGYVGEGPGGLKLQLRKICSLKELDKARDDALLDDLLNGRVTLCSKINCKLNLLRF